jgi:hypothetical protein
MAITSPVSGGTSVPSAKGGVYEFFKAIPDQIRESEPAVEEVGGAPAIAPVAAPAAPEPVKKSSVYDFFKSLAPVMHEGEMMSPLTAEEQSKMTPEQKAFRQEEVSAFAEQKYLRGLPKAERKAERNRLQDERNKRIMRDREIGDFGDRMATFVPLKGAGDAVEEAVRQGEFIAGKGPAGAAAAIPLAALATVGTVFNPIMAGARELPKQAASLVSAGRAALTDDPEEKRRLEKMAQEQSSMEGKLFPGLTAEKAEKMLGLESENLTADTLAKFAAEQGVEIAQDPVNYAFMAAGLRQMGGNVYGRMKGRKGQAPSPTVSKILGKDEVGRAWLKQRILKADKAPPVGEVAAEAAKPAEGGLTVGIPESPEQAPAPTVSPAAAVAEAAKPVAAKAPATPQDAFSQILVDITAKMDEPALLRAQKAFQEKIAGAEKPSPDLVKKLNVVEAELQRRRDFPPSEGEGGGAVKPVPVVGEAPAARAVAAAAGEAAPDISTQVAGAAAVPPRPVPAPALEAPKIAEPVKPVEPTPAAKPAQGVDLAGQEGGKSLIKGRKEEGLSDSLDNFPDGTVKPKDADGVDAGGKGVAGKAVEPPKAVTPADVAAEQITKSTDKPVSVPSPAVGADLGGAVRAGSGFFEGVGRGGVVGLLRSSLKALGFTLEEHPTKVGVTADARGAAAVRVGEAAAEKIGQERGAFEGLKGKELEAAKDNMLRLAANHELIHAALHKAWIEEWRAAVKGGYAKNYVEFSKEKSRAIFNEIEDSIAKFVKGGNTAAADLIRKALYDSHNIYWTRQAALDEGSAPRILSHENTMKLVDGEELSQRTIDRAGVENYSTLQRFLDDHPDAIRGYLFEFLRQLKEVKDTKVTSDSAWKMMVAKITSYIQEALGRLSGVGEMARKGNLGEKIKQALEQQDVFYEKAKEAGKAAGPDKIPEGSMAPMDATRVIDEMIPSAPDPILEEMSRSSEKDAKRNTFEEGLNRLVNDVGARIAGSEKVSPWFKREFYREPMIQTLEKAGGRLKDLGRRIRTQIDEARSLAGALGEIIQKPYDAARAMGEPVLKQALDKFEQYMKLREENKVVKAPGMKLDAEQLAKEKAGIDAAEELYKSMAPHEKAMVDAAKQMARDTHETEKTIGRKVIDPLTGEIRDAGSFGEWYWPKMLSKKVADILKNKEKFPEEFKQLMREVREKHPDFTAEEAYRLCQSALSWDIEGAFRYSATDFGRTNYLPGSWYEYRYENVLPDFVQRYAQRITQIKHYGQSLSFDGVVKQKDVFQHLHSAVVDADTRTFLKGVSEAVYGSKDKSPAARAMSWARTYNIATKLGTIWSAFKNLAPVFVNTLPEFGARHSTVGAYKMLQEYGKSVRKTQSAGAIPHEMTSALSEVWDLSKAQRKITGTALKWSGFNLAEEFGRVHAAMSALSWGKWAVGEIAKNPESRASKQARAKLLKYGVDAKILAQEGMDGPMSKKLMRQAVNDTHFSYDIRQVPGWSDTPTGKWYFQFGKYGIQQLNRFVDSVVKPATVGVKYEVSPGKFATVRDFKPLLWTLVAATGTGEAFLSAFRPFLFGKDRKDANWTEIGRALSQGDKEGINLLAWHLIHNILYVGALGTLGDQATNLEDFSKTNRTKDILMPPSGGTLDNMWGNVIKTMWDQGGKFTMEDMKRAMWRELPLVNYTMSGFQRLTGSEELKTQRKLFNLRRLGYMYATEADLQRFASQAQFSKTPKTPAYSKLQKALLMGNAEEAKAVIDELMVDAKTPAERKKLSKSIKNSISARRPMKVGAIDTEDERADFAGFIKRRAGDEALGELLELEKTYADTARKALRGIKISPPARWQADLRASRMNRQLQEAE